MIIRSISLFLALFAVVLIEDGFISSLPYPLSLTPLVFVLGVLLYHFTRPSLGCVWLIAAGALLDFIGLPGSSHLLAYATAGLVGLFLDRRVFTNHSLYAMIGLGTSMWTVSSLIEEIWMAVRQAMIGRPLLLAFFSEIFWTRLFVFSLALLVAFMLIRRFSTFIKRQFLLRG